VARQLSGGKGTIDVDSGLPPLSRVVSRGIARPTGMRVPAVSRQSGLRSRRDQPYLESSKPPHIIAAAPIISQAVNALAAIHIDLSMTRPSSALNVSMRCGPKKFAAREKLLTNPGHYGPRAYRLGASDLSRAGRSFGRNRAFSGATLPTREDVAERDGLKCLDVDADIVLPRDGGQFAV